MIRHFRHTGGFAPSSPFLAKAIAESLPHPLTGMVLELGPGTGALTQGMLKSGISSNQIITIECSHTFAKKMQTKFAEILTIEGDAQNLPELLQNVQKPIQVIVSSLPLRVLPNASVEKILMGINQTLTLKGYYIQFTYLKKENPIESLKQFSRLYSKRIFLNLPPARVDVFQKTD